MAQNTAALTKPHSPLLYDRKEPAQAATAHDRGLPDAVEQSRDQEKAATELGYTEFGRQPASHLDYPAGIVRSLLPLIGNAITRKLACLAGCRHRQWRGWPSLTTAG